MYLETLDVRSNDVLIYSQNKFDFETNFKIIHKRDKIKKPRSINYFEVCNYIKSIVPKNLVVYRLLTNVSNINAYSTKYGYFINMDNRNDIIYFDPIFALEDLKYLQFQLNENQFRFKIQQLGLKSKHSGGNEAEYIFEYSTDLRASEAKNQDDKIFADAIFAFDDSYSDEFDIQLEKSVNNYKNPKSQFHANIVEVNQSHDIKSLESLDVISDQNVMDVRDKKMLMLKKALGLTSAIQDDDPFKNKKINDSIDSNSDNDFEEKSSEIFDLFKSSQKKASMQEEKGRNSFLLRLTSDR